MVNSLQYSFLWRKPYKPCLGRGPLHIYGLWLPDNSLQPSLGRWSCVQLMFAQGLRESNCWNYHISMFQGFKFPTCVKFHKIYNLYQLVLFNCFARSCMLFNTLQHMGNTTQNTTAEMRHDICPAWWNMFLARLLNIQSMISNDAWWVPAVCNFEPCFVHVVSFHLGTTMWNQSHSEPGSKQPDATNEVRMDWPLSVAEKQSRAFELYQREAGMEFWG